MLSVTDTKSFHLNFTKYFNDEYTRVVMYLTQKENKITIIFTRKQYNIIYDFPLFYLLPIRLIWLLRGDVYISVVNFKIGVGSGTLPVNIIFIQQRFYFHNWIDVEVNFISSIHVNKTRRLSLKICDDFKYGWLRIKRF